MRVANSSMYNRSGRSIVNVTHAITLLGWETVRNLIGAMRFVEQFARHSPGLRELMMFSLLTATHSRHIAAVLRYPRPEEAYVCGLFRNMGEVLTARYFSEEYAKVVVAMRDEQLPERVAGLQVLEFEMDSLARCLAASWNMPACIRTCLAGSEAAAETIEERVLASAANYGHDLTSGLYRYGRFEPERMKALVDCTGRKYLLPYADLKRIVDAATEDTRDTFHALQIPVAALHLDQQAKQAREVLASAVDPDRKLSLAEFDAVLQSAESQINGPNFDVTAFIEGLLHAMSAHAGFDNPIFALMNEDRSSIRGRLSGSPALSRKLESFRFVMTRMDVILAAVIDRKQDLWIDRRTDTRFESSRVLAAFNPQFAVVLPVVVDRVVAGFLYADHTAMPGLAEMRPRLEALRNLVAVAIAQMRLR